MKKHLSFLLSASLWPLVFGLWSAPAFANNLRVTNFTDYAIDTGSNTRTFSFTISQENSWRSATNYDAAWIFLKYSTDGVNWSTCKLSQSGINPAGFYAPDGFEIIVPTDKIGFFVQRTSDNTGTSSVTAAGARLVWNYGANGLSDATAQSGNTMVKIFAVEMVYIPQGSFSAGDGSGNDPTLQQGSDASADFDPWSIASEGAIVTDPGAGNGYYYESSGQSQVEDASGTAFTIPAAYPKGYQAFYLMKYELTEGQWVSFFNTLATPARTNRDVTSAVEGAKNSDATISRNTISWSQTALAPNNFLTNATTLRADRPVSYISWPDLCAYADWAGLRPITDLEFEKAARGAGVAAVAGEYVWGNTIAAAAVTFSTTPESGTERFIAIGTGTTVYNNTTFSKGDDYQGGPASAEYAKGPARSGIFATVSSIRATSGAGYYGNMELSGNLWEFIVTLGVTSGRLFEGSHGDGTLTTLVGYEGHATNADWPGITGTSGVTKTKGSGMVGGDWSNANLLMRVSDRTYASCDADAGGLNDCLLESNQRTSGHGGRLGRTAP